MKSYMLTTVILAFLLATASAEDVREWQDDTGKFSVDAELLEIEDGKAVLKKTDGSVIRVPTSRLSGAGRRYLRSWKKSQAKKAEADAEAVPESEPSPEKLRWTMNPAQMKIPNAKVSGRLHGQTFVMDKTELSGSVLTLSEDKEEFYADRYVKLGLFLQEGETLVGKKYRIAGGMGMGMGVPQVHIQWKKEGTAFGENEVFMDKYAMLLQIGKTKAGQLPGKIYLCLPDESKSVIAGRFSVEIFDKTHPEVTQTEISGKVIVRGKHKDLRIMLSCMGLNPQGELEAEGAGFKLGSSAGGRSTDMKHPPRFSSAAWDEEAGRGSHKHVNRPPGHYLVCVRGRSNPDQNGRASYGGCYDWKWVELKNDKSKVKVDLTIDPDNTGSLEVSLPDGVTAKSVSYLPLDDQGKLPLPEVECHYQVQFTRMAKLEDGKAEIKSLRPGKYQLATLRRDRNPEVGYFGFVISAKAEVEVKRGETVTVELTPVEPDAASTPKSDTSATDDGGSS